MAALASSLIRQKREVREPGGSRPVSAQRRVCPRGTKSLCQKQLLILLSKVRLCGGRPTRQDRGPGGRFEGRSLTSQASQLLSAPLQHRTPHPPTHTVLRLRAGSRDSFHPKWRGLGGSGRLGHPEGFCSPGCPAPAPVLPPLHALALFLLVELAWPGANLSCSPPGVLAATSSASPLRTPSFCDLRFENGAGHPLPLLLCDSEIQSYRLRGPSASRISHTVQAEDLHWDLGGGSYHLQGGTGESAESKPQERRDVRVGM
uniref:fibroblast growth factor 11 isoform X1 n=1 Tax=Arvicanthis niloticus TaxID=61156 RepID=UPI00402BC670